MAKQRKPLSSARPTSNVSESDTPNTKDVDAGNSSWTRMDLPEEVFDALDCLAGSLGGIIDHDSDESQNGEIVAAYIRGLQGRIEALSEPLEFEYKAGRPLMLVKLGSDARGWIPNVKHFDHVRRVLKAAGEDKRVNILLNHYAISMEFPAGHPDNPFTPASGVPK